MCETVFNRFASVDIITGIFILEDIVIQSLVIRFFAKQNLVAIEVYEVGMVLIREGKGIGLVFDPNVMTLLVRTVIDIDCNRKPEHLARFLRLIYDHLYLVSIIIIDIVDR